MSYHKMLGLVIVCVTSVSCAQTGEHVAISDAAPSGIVLTTPLPAPPKITLLAKELPSVERVGSLKVNAVELQRIGPTTQFATLQLFDDLAVTVDIRQRVTPPSGQGQAWAGRLVDKHGYFALSTIDNRMFATVIAPGRGVIVIRPTADGHAVTQFNPALFPECVTGAEQVVQNAAAQPKAFDAVPNAVSVIEVLVLYTPDAAKAAGGVDNIRGEIEQAVIMGNLSLQNSGATATLHLANSVGIQYADSGSIDTDLTRLKNKNDGFIDDAHRLRDDYHADLVCLFVEKGEPGAAGIGYLMKDVSPTFESSAFSVVRRAWASSNLSFIHEIGHNIGCDHDAANSTGGVPGYAHGYRFMGQKYRTVMAYLPGERIPHFSNPLVSFQGSSTGDPQTADNVRRIGITASTVEEFRR